MPQQQQMNQMGNPQHMMRPGVPMSNIRANVITRPVARVNRAQYGPMNMGPDQDMLTYPNQGIFMNRNQQNQTELTPPEKLSNLIDKL